jgi:hypothetical protein
MRRGSGGPMEGMVRTGRDVRDNVAKHRMRCSAGDGLLAGAVAGVWSESRASAVLV